MFIQLYNDRKRLRLFEAVQSHKTLRSDCVFVLDTVCFCFEKNLFFDINFVFLFMKFNSLNKNKTF